MKNDSKNYLFLWDDGKALTNVVIYSLFPLTKFPLGGKKKKKITKNKEDGIYLLIKISIRWKAC